MLRWARKQVLQRKAILQHLDEDGGKERKMNICLYIHIVSLATSWCPHLTSFDYCYFLSAFDNLKLFFVFARFCELCLLRKILCLRYFTHYYPKVQSVDQ